MRIGILSDTHNRLPAMKAAMQVLRTQNVEFYIHCGDVGSERILDQLAGVASAFVWGNTDWDHAHLKRYAERLNIQCADSFADLNLGGKRIAVIHGDDFRLKNQILAAQQHDYLLQGHTHVREDQIVGKIHCINPGALHRAKEKTVAVLDTETDRVEFLIVVDA